MTDRTDAIARAVEALDFLPLGLNVKAARPPQDADGLEAMYAAIALHKLLRHYRHSGAAVASAWQAHEQFVDAERAGPHGEELKPLLARYREALTDALQAVAEDDGAFADLIRWYKQDLKRVDD